MRRYYRVALGSRGKYAQDCLAGNFIGVDFDIHEDLTGRLPEDLREFNQEFIPKYMALRPDKTKIAAGLSMGQTHTLCRSLHSGDIVFCSDGSGGFHVGEVAGSYLYVQGGVLPHRRPVNWLPSKVQRSEMSVELGNSTGSNLTVINLDKYGSEIEQLLSGVRPPVHALPVVTEEGVEDPAVFVLERHLEDFLVHNWTQTALGRTHDILSVDGEVCGQQYPSDTGPIDILAISKDQRELLVIELKKGKASDTVVGQTQRYMGYVQEVLAEPGQTVRGLIIALEDDVRIRRALAVAINIDFYRYRVSFELVKS